MENNVFFLSLNLQKEIPEDFYRLVSLKKIEKLKRYKYDVDKKLSLYSEILVRYIICKKLKLNNTELLFSTNEYGKPYLINNTRVHYNISHTQNAVAVFFSDCPVGIDIEKDSDAPMEIAKRYFTKDEIAYVFCNTRNQQTRFFEIWTQKEAYIKYIGKGFSLPLESFNVISLKNKICTYKIKEYIISTCSDYLSNSLELKYLYETEFVQQIQEWCIEMKYRK